MDGSPTSLTLAEAASAAILGCDDNNVRTAANCEPMQTNAITSENTPKHSSMKMFSLFGLSAPTTKEADQIPQSARSEEDCGSFVRW